MTEDESLEESTEDEEQEGTPTFQLGKKYSKVQLEEMADVILRDDSNRELCRQCKEANDKRKNPDRDFLPYGEETGHIEWQLRVDGDNNAVLDEQGDVCYIAFPELQCGQNHRWYKGEGTRRDIRGPNPILFESHLYYRRRREIQTEGGVPDPAYTMDRWGKRPTVGIYGRTHPQGRKVNSKESRERSGSSFYR